MSELPNIEIKKKDEMIEIVLTNIGRMFARRGYTSNLDNSELPNDVKKEIILNKLSSFTLGSTKISIHIIDQEVKNIPTNSELDSYLNKNIDHIKFLLVKNFAKKTYKQVINDYKNVEIFYIHEFLEDIPAKSYIPEHKIIVDEERNELLERFTLKEFGRIYSTDMMARYYGAKLNDIFRISRPNITSGVSVYYRIVVPGSLEFFI